MHPFFEYDLNGNNYDQNMTMFYPKLRLKYDWYVKIETINKYDGSANSRQMASQEMLEAWGGKLWWNDPRPPQKIEKK